MLIRYPSFVVRRSTCVVRVRRSWFVVRRTSNHEPGTTHLEPRTEHAARRTSNYERSWLYSLYRALLPARVCENLAGAVGNQLCAESCAEVGGLRTGSPHLPADGATSVQRHDHGRERQRPAAGERRQRSHGCLTTTAERLH